MKLIALFAISTGLSAFFGVFSVFAQTQNSTSAVCAPHAEVAHAQLYGDWTVEVTGQAPARLRLERHPDYDGSFAGHLQRGGQRTRVVADLDEGELHLEESQDGTAISAVWTAPAVSSDCGRTLRGQWRAAGREATQAFVMRRDAGW